MGVRVVYTHSERELARGSAHKYYALLAEQFGGQTIPRVTPDQLREAGAELLVCHGDRHRHYVAAVRAGIPYLLCEQDVVSLRSDNHYGLERRMVEGAAGVIFTSEDHEAYLRQRGLRIPPSLLVHLRPRLRDLQFEALPKLPGKHLVYAGGLVGWRDRTWIFGYRAYHRIFEAFIAAGWTVHLYASARPDVMEEYARLGCVVHGFVEHAELYRETSQYTAAFHGYNRTDVPERAFAYTQLCRPNKTWDGLGAGLPTISFDGGNSARIMVVGGWGVVLPDLSPAALTACEPERLPVITEGMRLSQTLETDAPRLKAFVEEILSRAARRSAA